MDRRAKRRRTAVNYAKMAAGDFDFDSRVADSEDDSPKKSLCAVSDEDEEASNGQEQEPEVETAEAPSLRRRRRKPITGRSVSLKLPAAVLEAKKESEREDRREKERKKERVKKEKEKPKNRRVVMSDSDDEEFGLDNDESEDFVPRRGKRTADDDDDQLEDEDLDEAELEALEEARAATGKPPGENKGFKALQSALERKNSSGGRVMATTPRAPRLPVVAPVLSRSLSGGRSGTMMKGAQGRLLKKIGFKAPLVTPSAAKAAVGGELMKLKSLQKGIASSGTDRKPQMNGAAGMKGLGKSPKENLASRPWFSTPGMGKWDRKSTAILDDSELLTTAKLPNPPPIPETEVADAGSVDPLLPEAPKVVEEPEFPQTVEMGSGVTMLETQTPSEVNDEAKHEILDKNSVQPAVENGKEDGEASEDGELLEDRLHEKVVEAREEVGMPGSSLPRFGLVSSGD